MNDKLGFTFYPKDWWTSDSYFELTPIQRYYYLECLFIMYSNGGSMKTQITQFANRTRTQVLQSDWDMVISKFELINNQYTHVSVNKRLRKATANRENGKKGGRPKKDEEKPKEPNSETQNNPPLEIEREDKLNISINNNNIEARKLKFASTLTEFNTVYDRKLLKDFYEYWTEPNKSNTKFKQENEKTWSLSRRLKKWKENEPKFNKQNGKQKITDNPEFKQIVKTILSEDVSL